MDDWTPDLTQPVDSPVVEKFDPTWKYNFKWAYDPTTDRFDMWRVQGGSVDGRPYHRGEATRLWGREPEAFGGKDILGVGSYIPAERKLDGTIVAPPVVLLQAYYKREIPQAAYDWVEENFPGTVARAARLAAGQDFAEWKPDMTQESNQVIRWVWSRENGTLIWQASSKGLPTHDQKILQNWGREPNPNDKRGYAIPDGDKLDIESYDPGVPPLAYQVVKQELSKMFPNYRVSTPDDTVADHGVTFGDNVQLLSRHRVAGRYIEGQLTPSEMPVEALVSDSQPLDSETGTGQRDSFLWRAMRAVAGVREGGSKADKEGAMVALFIPQDVGEKLKQKGGEPVEDMHITLAYFSDKAADRDDWDEVERIVEQIAKQHPPLSGKISGMGVFSNDVDVLWAAPSVPGLAELRDDIVEACEDAGFHVGTDHGWTPHITLKYDFKGKLPKIENHELELGGITFARGDDQKDFAFEGGFEKETKQTVEPEAEQWDGAHHFVTDGKEVHLVAEPRHEDGHEDEFRSMHGTEPDEETTEGWTIPTYDDKGFGIYAPNAGFKTDDEPQLHEIQNALEKELGKPGHFIEDWDGFTAA